MSWHEILGHDRQIDRFRRSVERRRLASTFLFVGPAGIGKRTFARKLAQALLCERHSETELDPCGECEACQQVAAGTHPDLEEVGKPADRSFIPIETFIGDREHRMREGLCFRIGMKPMRGGRKVAIIDDADYLNIEGANCLLKTLEEPPPRSVIILIGASEQRQLPTIRSRSQIVRFSPLCADDVTRLLLQHRLVDDESEAARLAAMSGGSVGRAVQLADPELAEFRSHWFDHLSMGDVDLVELSSHVSSFVDKAGKEASDRRARVRLIAEFAADFYRELMLALAGDPDSSPPMVVSNSAAGTSAAPVDDRLSQAVSRAVASWPGDAESAANCLERSLDVIHQVDANANQATLLECWLDDLWQLARNQPLAPIAP